MFTLRSQVLVVSLSLAALAASGCATDTVDDPTQLETGDDALRVSEAVGVWSGRSGFFDGVAGTLVVPEVHVFRDRSFVLTYARCAHDAARNTLNDCNALLVVEAAAIAHPEFQPDVMRGAWHRGARVEFDTTFNPIWGPSRRPFGLHSYSPIVFRGASEGEIGTSADSGFRIFCDGTNGRGQTTGKFTRGRGFESSYLPMVRVSDTPSDSLHR